MTDWAQMACVMTSNELHLAMRCEALELLLSEEKLSKEYCDAFVRQWRSVQERTCP